MRIHAEQRRRRAIIAGLVMAHVALNTCFVLSAAWQQTDFNARYLLVIWPLFFFIQSASFVLAAWAALGTGPSLIRIPQMLLASMILPLLARYATIHDTAGPQAAMVWRMSLVEALINFAIPVGVFHVTCRIGGWRIVMRDSWPLAGAGRQFHSRDLFFLIALASMLFAAMRAGAPTNASQTAWRAYIDAAVSGAEAACLQSLPMIPLLGFGLGQSARGRFAAAAVATVVAVIFADELLYLVRFGAAFDTRFRLIVFLQTPCTALAFLANVSVLRRAGLWLTRPCDRQSPAAEPLVHHLGAASIDPNAALGRS